MSTPTAPSASATVTVAAAPERVYALVSDLPRMGRLSPESTGGRWLGKQGPVVGARFVGTNKGPGRWWPTTTRVTEATPGRRFAFETTIGPIPAAGWAYDIVPVEGGCEVTESWYDRRGAAMVVVGKVVTGVADREGHTRTMLESTLAKVKDLAESGA